MSSRESLFAATAASKQDIMLTFLQPPASVRIFLLQIFMPPLSIVSGCIVLAYLTFF